MAVDGRWRKCLPVSFLIVAMTLIIISHTYTLHTIYHTIYHIPYTIPYIPCHIYHIPYTIHHIPYTIYCQVYHTIYHILPSLYAHCMAVCKVKKTHSPVTPNSPPHELGEFWVFFQLDQVLGLEPPSVLHQWWGKLSGGKRDFFAKKKIITTPRKLRWNLKMMVTKRNLLFQGFIFRFHVSFLGCKDGEIFM